MSFHEVRFPEDISFGSAGGPEFSTNIVTVQSGAEQRNSNWLESRARYNIIHSIKNQSQLNVLIAFFRARKGRAYGFRFKDWADYSATNQQIGIGDDEQTIFQIIKTYTSGYVEVDRKITKPVEDSVKIYVDGMLQTSGYTVNYTNGEVTFDSAPATDAVVSSDFEFDVPVRFDRDYISSQFDSYGVNSINDIPLVEIRI